MSKLDNLQQLNTNTPRETIALETNGLVIKRPVAGRMPTKTWLGKQRHAKHVTDGLLKSNNDAYFVPQILEISEKEAFVIEQRAYGNPIPSSYFDTLSPSDHDIIYNALAHFINDMNQMRPVLTQAENFDAATSGDDEDGMTMATVMKKLSAYIPEEELRTVSVAKKWFDKASANDASVVFSHGDMNEHNIFYDPDRRIVSFIDFADAKYENAHYMFERNFGRLGWLDLDRLRAEYLALPRSQPVIIDSTPDVEKMRGLLQNFIWSATEFLHKPQVAQKVRIQIIKESIEKIKNLYTDIQKKQQFAIGKKIATIKAQAITPMPHTPGNQK